MTAPSLLDELEEVVRLAEKATPGPWLYRSKSNSWHKPPQQGTVYSYGEHIVGMDSDDEADNGWDEAFLIAAVQFMTTHHAELADMANELRVARESFKRCDEICKCTAEGWRTTEEDMAKRLEAAERDERGEREETWEIWERGMCIAVADDLGDAQHYLTMYGQDGPVKLVRVISYRETVTPDAIDATQEVE